MFTVPARALIGPCQRDRESSGRRCHCTWTPGVDVTDGSLSQFFEQGVEFGIASAFVAGDTGF